MDRLDGVSQWGVLMGLQDGALGLECLDNVARQRRQEGASGWDVPKGCLNGVPGQRSWTEVPGQHGQKRAAGRGVWVKHLERAS
jgi:hypothetical protein